MKPEPFRIEIEQPVLDDVRSRIRATRWPDAIPGVGWDHGTDPDFLRRALEYWAEEFDWRAREDELNRHAHFRADVDGTRIHFVHEHARDGDGIPLVLTHGWPSSFVELLPLVPLLTDPANHGLDGPSFDVVIPSLPGYGFSERPLRTGVTALHVTQRAHGVSRSARTTRPWRVSNSPNEVAPSSRARLSRASAALSLIARSVRLTYTASAP